MLQPSTIKFLSDLKKNNNRPWMENNKNHYITAKNDFLELVIDVIRETAKFDPAIGELDAKNCIFRINRDIRFSKNKSPYKTNMAAFMNVGGKKNTSAGYYFHLEPGGSFIAGGIYAVEGEVLAKIRQEIDYNLAEWESVILSKKFTSVFPDGLSRELSLARPPKGYDADNPAIEYLKLKSFTVSHKINDAFFLEKDSAKNISKNFRLLLPMVSFLNKAIS